MHVIDVEAMLKLQDHENFWPGHPDLGCYVYPKTLNMYIVYTPEMIRGQAMLISSVLELPSPDIWPSPFSLV